jgi:UDP-N-acetylmuramate--alanine ligase
MEEFTGFRPGMHVHLVGIGGAGLSAIARVLQSEGCVISGSDQAASAATEQLAALGAGVTIGHAAGNIAGAEVVIVSAAIQPDNPEIAEARRRHIPVVKRADVLGYMMTGRVGVAVAGTHGKTTTTAMIAQVLIDANLDPTVIVGGVMGTLGANARAGKGPFVVEADEYDRMFLGLKPWAAVVTNIEHDHPDCYPTLDDMLQAFHQFVDLLPADGLLAACWDSLTARQLGQNKRAIFYGLGKEAHWQATNLQPNAAGGMDFVALRGGQTVGLMRLRVPGQHNVLNALATLIVADALGVPFAQARDSLREFVGVGRRFEIAGEADGVTVVDDYGHHPTEIRATLSAARARFAGRAVWAVFQPHTYSRVKAFLPGFASAFSDADHVIVTEIFAARERDTLGISGADVVQQASHRDARYIAKLEDAAAYLLAHIKPGDVIITLSAGDGNGVGEMVLNGLRKG